MLFCYLAAYFWVVQKGQNIERLLKTFSLGKWKAFTIFLFEFFIIVNAGHDSLTRRLLGFLNSAPIWVLFLLYGAGAWKTERHAVGLLVASLRFLFAAIPGLQLASFFGGVSGWLMSNTNHNFQLGDDFQLIT